MYKAAEPLAAVCAVCCFTHGAAGLSCSQLSRGTIFFAAAQLIGLRTPPASPDQKSSAAASSSVVFPSTECVNVSSVF